MNQSYLNCISLFNLQLHLIIETVNNWASWLQCYLTGSVSRYEYLCISMLAVGLRTFLTFLETVYRTAAPLPPLRTVYAHRSCCFVASLPAFKIWAYLTQNLMWAGEKGKVKEVESFTYHKMQIVRYATGGGVRLEGERSVIVYAITTFWAQAKFPVLFM